MAKGAILSVLLAIIVSILGFQSERRFDTLIARTTDHSEIEAYQVAWTNLWMLCNALAFVLFLYGAMISCKASRGVHSLFKFALGLAINNLLDELFFNPMEINDTEIWAAVISAYIALTEHYLITPLKTSMTFLWNHRPSWMRPKNTTSPSR